MTQGPGASPRSSSAAARPPILVAERLVRHFRVETGLFGNRRLVVRAVDDVSLSVGRGETLGIVGESGCGKSTLGRMLLGLLAPTSGRVLFDGEDLALVGEDRLRALRRRMQLVFQDPHGALNPRLRIEEAIGEPLEIHHPELSREGRRARVHELLARVGLREEHASRLPAEFSGGQRQRIVIARALAVEPELLALDEPVSALDVSIQAQILNLLADLQEERNLAMVFVSHDLKVIEHVATSVAVLYLGKIVELAPRAPLFAGPLHPYASALLSAIPDPRPGGRRRARVLLSGEPPSPISPPGGCSFHPRCPRAKQLAAEDRRRCSVEAPSLVPVPGAPGRSVACHFPGP